MVEDALKRYYALINKHQSNYQSFRIKKTTEEEKPWKGHEKYSGYLDLLQIDMMGPCENYPHENMDESCELGIRFKKNKITHN